MPAIAFATRLLPGRADADRRAMESCWRGSRREAYEDARRRAGITKESVWLQTTADGDVVVVYLEADDIARALAVLGESQEAFDVWFREELLDVHGVALEEGFVLPVPVLDFDGDRAGRMAP
jgi:hypothetical protein